VIAMKKPGGHPLGFLLTPAAQQRAHRPSFPFVISPRSC